MASHVGFSIVQGAQLNTAMYSLSPLMNFRDFIFFFFHENSLGLDSKGTS